MKRLLSGTMAALCMAVGLLASGTTLATTTTLGTLGTSPNAGTVVYGVPNTSFSDIYNFSIAPPNTSASGLVLSFNDGFFSILGFTAQLFNAFGGGGTSLFGPIAIPSNGLSLSGLMAPGDYSVVLTGTTGPTGGGYYTYVAGALPVPEPGEWAMLLAGLGFIGTMVRRRRTS